MRTEDIRNMAKAYAAVQEKAKKEAMDPVNPSELKGKHKDRKDKDIDNDGDVDSTDQYLHKRRKAISKSKKETASKSTTTVSKDSKTDTDVQTQEAKVDEISKGKLGSYIKKANINTADAADQNARGAKQIGKVMKRFKGVGQAVDKLTGKAKVPARESVEIDEAAKGTAQHKPDEKTRDTWEKQLSTRKGEKDFKDQHKAETPEAGDEPKVDALNFQKFKSMVAKKDNSRPADQKKGDNNIIPSATPVKQ